MDQTSNLHPFRLAVLPHGLSGLQKVLNLGGASVGVARVDKSVQELHCFPNAHCGAGLFESLATGLDIELNGLLGVLLATRHVSRPSRESKLHNSHVEPTGTLIGVNKLAEVRLVLLRVKLGLVVCIVFVLSLELGDVDLINGVRNGVELGAGGVYGRSQRCFPNRRGSTDRRRERIPEQQRAFRRLNLCKLE